MTLGHTPVKFKTDTYADVTLLSEEIYKLTGLEKLRKATKKLFGPRHAKLSVTGVVTGNLRTGNGRKHDKIFNVVANLKEPLLGKQAIEALKLILTCPTTSSKQKLQQITQDCLKDWED